MSLTPADIARIANLARLELAPPEAERMLGQINDFFQIVEKMRAVDTRGVEPLPHPMAAIQEVSLRLREDQVSEPARPICAMRQRPRRGCSWCPA